MISAGEFMNASQTQVLQECAKGALTGTLAFPEIVGRLTECGIERYHADSSRQEITYYSPDGDSVVIATPHPARPVSLEFSASAD
jgi:uncharacterized protein YbcV (DUF1398 family)